VPELEGSGAAGLRGGEYGLADLEGQRRGGGRDGEASLGVPPLEDGEVAVG
jgi:hypothetical protein